MSIASLHRSLASIHDDDAFDVVVIGAGGAGLSAALFAAIAGARVLVVEHTEYAGGTTALSAGTTWVPATHHAATVGVSDSIEAAALYLDHVVGDRSARELRHALLSTGAEAIATIEANSAVKYRPYALHPDYQSEEPGATLKGRALEPVPFDGRLLGELFALLRPPIPEFTVLGGMMVDRTDINHLLALTKNFKSFKHAASILARHARDRLRYPRGTRLVMGNALVARLLYSLAQRDTATLLTQTSLTDLHRNAQGAIDAVSLTCGSDTRRVRVRGGVVLASGGFNRHAMRRAEMLGNAIDATWCPAASGHTGAAHDIALKIGAHYGQTGMSNAFWAPVSLRKRADGSTAAFPHFVMDRAKPGFITVNQAGKRFVNESTSYHLFGLAMQRAHAASPSIPAYLICDATALKKYGIGMVRPGGSNAQALIEDGYLTRADSLDALAAALGINASGLRDSVTQLNAYAAQGNDPDFHRGETAYQGNIGDANAGTQNPNLGTIATAPFYAVKLYPGDIGAATGLQCDANARVLDAQSGAPIAGLYAVGNDMHSVMGGAYPGPGITIGPGLVFAYIATRDALVGCETKR